VRLRFVVTGRPNKGKSSLVAALARRDEVAISPQSGTTRRSERFDFVAGDERLALVDTPGIQRPSKVLAWLQQRAAASGSGADRRPALVAEFLADPDNAARYADEVDVLQAILAEDENDVSTAIIYVVDGSVPYDRDYEQEMSVLQWTGRPSIAVINPIEGARYVEQWQAALNQYFKLVRVFDTHADDLDAQVTLLEDFAHVDPGWRQPLGRIVDGLRRLSREQARRSAAVAAELLDDMCHYALVRRVPSRHAAQQLEQPLRLEYQQHLRSLERRAMDTLQEIYGHRRSGRETPDLEVPHDLFDTEAWSWWGLDRRRLALAGAGAGALAGAGADALSAGLSLGTATAGGALLGAAGAWFGADRLQRWQWKLLPSGLYEARQGPIRSANFPYVVLGRLLYLQALLRRRSHARRDALRLDAQQQDTGPLAQALEELDPQARKRLNRALQDLSRQRRNDGLYDALLPLFDAD
jgi:hypothetical protein